MSSNFILILTVIAIFAAIIIGWKTKINTGLIAMAFAYLIGMGLLGMSSRSLLALWPNNVIFYLMIATLYFSFATENGTMEVLAKKLLRLVNGKAWAVPWMLYLVSLIIGLLGAGSAGCAIVLPIAYAIGMLTGHDLTFIGVGVGLILQIGNDNPFYGQMGLIGLGLIQDSPLAEHAFAYTFNVWIFSIIKQTLVFTVLYFLTKGYKGKNVEIDREEALSFNSQQKTTLVITLVALGAVVLSKILNTFISNPAIRKFSTMMEPQYILVCATVLMAALKLGDTKKAFSKLPMNTVFMIAGVTMLMGVCKEAGMVDVISGWISESVPRGLILGCLTAVCAFTSCFSGAVSVVCPLFYPMVPALAASSGLPASALYTAIYVGATTTSSFPFSSGGGTTMTFAPTDEIREGMFYNLMKYTLISAAIVTLMGFSGIFTLLG